MSKVAIVTGSSRGIGRACALRLAKEGMDVVVNYNSNEAEAMKVVNAIKDMGQDAIAIKANTGNQNDVKNMFREAFKHFGHIDVLVNNAGVLDDAYLLAINSDSLDRSMDVNVKILPIDCASSGGSCSIRRSAMSPTISSRFIPLLYFSYNSLM